MGEAKRRFKASPYVETTAGQMLRKLNAMAAALPPAPMNGATLLEVSPDDYKHVLAQPEARTDCFTGANFLGLSFQQNAMLPNGTFIVRRRGKAVWSNNPSLQELIDSGWFDPTPTLSGQATDPAAREETRG
jgi:hypothetical protein